MASKQKKQDKSSTSGGKSQGGVAVAGDNQQGKIQSFIRYFEDSKTELGKVSWPTKQEVKATSFAVLILVVVMCIFLGLVDLVLAKIVEAILSIGL